MEEGLAEIIVKVYTRRNRPSESRKNMNDR